jgi:hypothetical protein
MRQNNVLSFPRQHMIQFPLLKLNKELGMNIYSNRIGKGSSKIEKETGAYFGGLIYSLKIKKLRESGLLKIQTEQNMKAKPKKPLP